MEKTIEELEQELADLKATHLALWSQYGTELCTGDMIAEEKKLELEIKKAKTIKRWEGTGMLEGLDGDVMEKCAILFEAQQSYIINEPEKEQFLKLQDVN